MSGQDGVTCATCWHWNPDHAEARTGECRRLSPTKDPAATPNTAWPKTRVNHWCGEYCPHTSRRY